MFSRKVETYDDLCAAIEAALDERKRTLDLTVKCLEVSIKRIREALDNDNYLIIRNELRDMEADVIPWIQARR